MLVEAQELLPAIKKGDPLPANRFVDLAKLVNPAVVNISTATVQRYQPRGGRGRDPFFDLFELYMMGDPRMRQQPMQALGTGFIIRDDGLIITNNHVVEGADTVKVQINENDKETYDAKVIGLDKSSDLALIKIDAKRKLPFIRLGSSKELEVGEWVAAFGNPFGHGHSMTKGIISAIGREIDEINLYPFIQTDASINPGNSGGPLVNIRGEVIGVNAAIDARAQGIGFAIPVDNVKSLLPQLEKDGKIKRGYMGVALQDISDEEAASIDLKTSKGALVVHVEPGSPADKGGVKPRDLIIEFNGRAIKNSTELSKEVLKVSLGDAVKVKLNRRGKMMDLTVKISDRPAEPKLAARDDSGMGGFFGGRGGGGFGGGRGFVDPRDDGRGGLGGRGGSDSKALRSDKLGFAVVDYSKELLMQMGLLPLSEPRPIVTMVDPMSPAGAAGLEPGDIILDVNQKSVTKAKDVISGLKKSSLNAIRVLKGDRIVAVFIRSK